MITKRTKVQLMVFVLITLVGVSYVGARYARLDRLLFDDSYRVVAHFQESGGIFEGAEVTYRGISIGKVGDMVLTEQGVDVLLDIDNDTAPIPADTGALVGNRSAVGEQYVELQPNVDDGPFLEDGSEIADAETDTPISSTKLLVDLDRMVNSVNKDSLRTVVSEMGRAFNGTGESLGDERRHAVVGIGLLAAFDRAPRQCPLSGEPGREGEQSGDERDRRGHDDHPDLPRLAAQGGQVQVGAGAAAGRAHDEIAGPGMQAAAHQDEVGGQEPRVGGGEHPKAVPARVDFDARKVDAIHEGAVGKQSLHQLVAHRFVHQLAVRTLPLVLEHER